MPAEVWTKQQLSNYITKQYGSESDSVMILIARWLNRGDGAAVYENHDLGHPEVGRPQIVSFGSASAQLETDEPPTTLPDIGGAINWRYQLIATHREGKTDA